MPTNRKVSGNQNHTSVKGKVHSSTNGKRQSVSKNYSVNEKAVSNPVPGKGGKNK